MSAQDPTLRLIEAVQFIRHTPNPITIVSGRTPGHQIISNRAYSELCEAYDAYIEYKKEQV
jgi:hypothetical protein